MAESQILTDSNIEHSMYMVRYGQGRANTILPYLREVVSFLEGRLAKEGESITSKTRLNALLKDANSKMNTIYTEWDKSEFQPSLKAAMVNELEFQASSTEAVVEDFNSIIPTQKQVMAAAFENPLLIGARGGAVDFGKYTTDWKPQEIARVSSAISSGFYSGQTTSEITRNIVGLKSQRYANGILNMSRANIQGMVKSSISHMSSEAKSEFAKENDDLIIGMKWVSTLDSRTSAICRDRDGDVYLFKDYGQNYPRSPAHINCRSTLAPELSDEYSFLKESRTRPAVSGGEAQEVSGNTTYYEWLKRQPAKVQNEALGVEKGKIFRNSGLTPEEYKKAATNQFGKSMTIEQMARKNKDIASYLNKQ